MNKRAHVVAARALLDSGDNVSLPYAALELRMAMEAIAYEKLRAYASRLPEEAFARWQAPQAIKALLEFEPHANREKRVAFGTQDGPGEPAAAMSVLGETRSFDLTWLRSAYNTLGSLLHLPTPRKASTLTDPASIAKSRGLLERIYTEVARVANATLEGGMAEVVYFNCARCDKTVVSNAEAVRSTRRAVCLSPSCSAVHVAEINTEDEFTFLLDAVYTECPECQRSIEIERRHISFGAAFRCASCETEYHFSHVSWQYDRTTPVADPGT